MIRYIRPFILSYVERGKAKRTPSVTPCPVAQAAVKEQSIGD